MSTVLNQNQRSAFIQLVRASALRIDAGIVVPGTPFTSTLVQPPARIYYPAYDLGYVPGSLIFYAPMHIANPPPIPEQFKYTSQHVYGDFSVVDLPDILFRLEAPPDRFNDPENPDQDLPVPLLYDAATRQPITNSQGDGLRYFAFLPRYIAKDTPGCMLEFWFRLDFRLEMNDVRMRIERDGAGVIPSGNTLNMRRIRFRENLKAYAWGASRIWPVEGELKVLDDLTAHQICLNTSMEIDTRSLRLLKPTFDPLDVKCAAPLGYFPSGLKMDKFLADPSGPIPSQRMMSRMLLRRRLQTLVSIMRPGAAGISRLAWRSLDARDAPGWWTRGNKTADGSPKNRKIREIDNLTHKEYLEQEIGDVTRLGGITQRNKVKGI